MSPVNKPSRTKQGSGMLTVRVSAELNNMTIIKTKPTYHGSSFSGVELKENDPSDGAER